MSSVSSTSPVSTYSTTSTASSGSSLGKDDFLNLMVAQLKYQNPLDPMDGTEYAAQLAQFSSLEQMTNMNDTLNQSVDMNYLLSQSVNNTMSTSLIGKEVKISGNKIKYNGEDSISLGYKLPTAVKECTITIKNSSGTVVKTIETSDLSSGNHKLSWDFTDNKGKAVSEGTYTYSIEAKSTSGKDLTISSSLYGVVNAVRFTDSGTMLVVGDSEYSLSDVTEISGDSSEE